MTTPEPSNNGAMIAMLAVVRADRPGRVVAESLLRHEVRTPGVQSTAERWPILLIYFGYFGVAWSLNARSQAIPAGAPTVATVALASIWLAIRDWPWRAYYLGSPSAAVAIGFIRERARDRRPRAGHDAGHDLPRCSAPRWCRSVCSITFCW